mmetsp:Transcript_14897/g.13097  ORF Transcript_14897/g.13097 Transcript_14897/m.13097 type:complete len:190 (-) Transcript_14897:52-621(-)
MNMKSQKIEEIELDFRDSFDSECEGKVLLKIQYVHDPVQLITDILASLERSEKLILRLLNELDNVKIKPDLRISTFNKEKCYKDTFYQGGQFYSSGEDTRKVSSDLSQPIEEGKSGDISNEDDYFDPDLNRHYTYRPSEFIYTQIRQEQERRRTKIYSFDLMSSNLGKSAPHPYEIEAEIEDDVPQFSN